MKTQTLSMEDVIGLQYHSNNIANIYTKITDIIDYYTEKHSKTLVVRFDVHYPRSYTGHSLNRDISTCIAYVIKKYKRQGLDPCYIWVREQHLSVHPHYHCALLLNGHKVRSYDHVFHTAEAAWERALGCSVTGCIDHCTVAGSRDYNGKMLRRDAGEETYRDRYRDILRQLSYLAKSYTKELGHDGQRNFGCTQLPH